MLKHLHISNFALISSLDIDFHAGLNIITGETGAGKSIMLGALALVFGARADSRPHSDNSKSVVEAEFSNPPEILKPIFEENGIEWDDNSCIIRREINPAGRSRAFVNDSPASLAMLKEISLHLVDIHSQHQNQLLAKPAFQLEIIDSLADNKNLLEDYSQKYNRLKSALKTLKTTKQQLKNSAENAAFIRFQLEKINKVNPQENEEQELEAQRDALENSIRNKTLFAEASDILSSDNGLLSRINRLQDITAELDSSLPNGKELTARLEQISLELDDIESEFNKTDHELTAGPSELIAIENRIAEIEELKKQFKITEYNELDAIRAKLTQQIDNLENATSIISEQEESARKALSEAKKSAKEISERRKNAAQSFALQLKELAKPLGMKNLECFINIEQADINSTGTDKVEFMFSFNKNQPPTPVANSASGGEISRLMLCIKAIIAQKIQLPSMLFDEIDTGVSGEVAAKMGQLMRRIASQFQAIVITHLPQVASKGEHHFKVYKQDDDTSTHTHIKELSHPERIKELTVMLGGDPDSLAARHNAEELLNN